MTACVCMCVPLCAYVNTCSVLMYVCMCLCVYMPLINMSNLHRLHYAIQAYKELLEYVQYMGESQDDTLRSNATIMKNNILYRAEYRDIFVTIIRNYNEVVSSRGLLRDLVEMVHIYLRLVEHFCKKKGRVLVQGKRKRKKSSKETTGVCVSVVILLVTALAVSNIKLTFSIHLLVFYIMYVQLGSLVHLMSAFCMCVSMCYTYIHSPKSDLNTV